MGCPYVSTRCMECSTDNVQKYTMSIDYPGSWRFSSQHCWKEFLPDVLLSQALLNSWWPCNYTQQDEEGIFLMCPCRTTAASTKRQRSSGLFQDIKLNGCDWWSKARLVFMQNKCQWQAEHPFLDYVTKLLELTYWIGWETPELSAIDLQH